MRPHVTSDQIARLRTGGMPLAEAADLARHTGSCPECMALIELETDLAERIATVRGQLSNDDPAHAAYEDLEALVDGSLDEARRVEVEQHVALCDLCTEDLDDLRSVQVTRRPQRRWSIAAAAAAVIAATALLLLSRDDAPDVPVVETSTVSTAAPSTETTTTAQATVVRDYGRADWNAWVVDALRSRTLRAPAALQTLRAGAISFRGKTPAGTAMEIVTPYGEVVRSTTPALVWSAPRGATSIAQIFGRRAAVATSDPLSTTRWTSPVALVPGETYTWQVEVTVGGRPSILPAPPAPPALFTVLDDTARRDIESAEALHPRDPLLLAVVYAKHGLQREAITALEKCVAESPSPEAKALLESVRGWEGRPPS